MSTYPTVNAGSTPRHTRMALLAAITLSLVLAFAVGQPAAVAKDMGSANETAETATDPAAGRPQLIVYKTPWCGCCENWARQAERADFAVELRDTEDLSAIKRALGVPDNQASCHTAQIDGYFVEGHVPFEDLRRLLAERPDARGIAVPGMPAGSPGMEVGVRHAFSTSLVASDGSISEFAHHPGGDGR